MTKVIVAFHNFAQALTSQPNKSVNKLISAARFS